MTTLQIRVDDKVKNDARKVFDDIGIDMTGAVTLFLHQVVITQGIPFRITTVNDLTVEDEQAILQASDEAKMGINVTKPMNAQEALKYLKAYDGNSLS